MVRWWIIVLNACWLCSVNLVIAEPAHLQTVRPLLTAVEQQLQVDTERQALVKHRLSRLKDLQKAELPSSNEQQLQRTLSTISIQEAEINSLDLSIKAAQMDVECTQASFNLQHRTQDIGGRLSSASDNDAFLHEKTKLVELQQKRIRVLQNTRDMLKKAVTLQKNYYKELYTQNHSTAQQYQDSLNSLIKKLATTQNDWMKQLSLLHESATAKENVEPTVQLPNLMVTLRMITMEQKSNTLHVQLGLEKASNHLNNLLKLLANHPSLMVLNTLQKPLETTFTHLNLLNDLLQKQLRFLNDNIELVRQGSDAFSQAERSKLATAITEFENCCRNYEKQLETINQLMQKGQKAQQLFTHQLHTYLSSRQGLPGFDFWAWFNIVKQLRKIPTLFSQRLVRLLDLMASVIAQSSLTQSALAGVFGLIWLRALILLKRLKRTNWFQSAIRADSTPTAFAFWFTLLHHHAYSLILSLGTGSLLLVWKIPFSDFVDLFTLLATHLLFSLVIRASRFWLLDTILEENRYRNKKVYLGIYGILSIGRLITLFSLVVHQLVVDYEVRNVVARLFMLFLLIIALVLFWLRVLGPRLLEGYWANRPRYLKQVARWLSLLLPITLLLNAILGLVGYVQLAWAAVGYQSVLLLALCIYPFIKGLLNECFNWLSDQSIRHLRNGWLWSEALLKPFYQLLKLLTLIALIALLFSVAGWQEELQTFMNYLARWFSKPLISVMDIPIDTWKVIQAAVMSTFVAWLSRWSREFAYRWVFANLKDVGLRNSLSILTQYVAIFVSILATLHMVGITLSVLKYVLSGFAIGLSFGLRDLLNNFVTGILLLVERPLKVGDWVTIGTYDGQVINIGARSISVKTEDNQELMVPNADLFYKHFINWTRDNSLVRLTLPVLVNRQDNPTRVRELILEVMSTIKKILNNPSPEVYFSATDQMLLAFRIEYYVDLTQITSRSEITSQFLFALWRRFTEENIMPPEVVHEVHVTGAQKDYQPSSVLQTDINQVKGH